MRRGVWMAAVAAALCVTIADPVSAAVLCQRKNRVKVRAETCKPKETQIQDLGALGKNASDVQGIFQATCAGAPERTLVVGAPTFLYDGDECTGGCRGFDGDQAACEGAFQLTWDGPTGCVYLDGKCFPCKDCGERAGRCIDVCEPVACADPTRTTFKGGPNTEACRDLATQADCEAAWAMQYGRQPHSCYWDGVANECFGCGDNNESNGKCTNTCRDPGECADPGRSYADYCGMFNGDETACNGAYTRGGGGNVPYTCYYDASDGDCEECRPVQELLGRCSDTCDTWP